MTQRTLRFKIRQDGVVEETVEGILGNSCQHLTENLEKALGAVQHREPTTESFLRPNKVQSQTIPAELI